MPKGKKEAAPPPVPDVKLDAMLESLLPVPPAAPASATAEPPTVEPIDPDAVVGTIAVAPTDLPDVKPEFHIPTPDELKGFPPPPPIAAPPLLPLAVAAPQPKGSVFPQATVMIDKSMHSGVIVGHVVQPPNIIADAPPPPPKEVTFDELPEKTKAEIRAGWLRTHGSMDGFVFGGNNTPPVAQRTDPIFDRVPIEPPAPPDLSKLSLKTQMELKAGADRLAQRTSDYRAVLAKVAASDAAKHEAGGAPVPSNMDYAKGA